MPEQELAAETNETIRTWRNRRNRGEAPPWCRIGRDVYYFEDKLGPWREAQMRGRISQRKGPREKAGRQ
jgi:hypothetical protein